MHRQHVRRVRSQNLPLEADTVDGILDLSDALVEIEEPAIIRRRAAGMFHIEQQISHRKVSAVGILAA